MDLKTKYLKIKDYLELTLESFNDGCESEGYDLSNETYYIKECLKEINILLGIIENE